MKKIYIAGPCTGLPESNYPAFHAEAARLRALGYEVENPAESEPPPCGTWEGWMRLGLTKMLLCDSVVLLPGWASSRGATIEHRLAVSLGMGVRLAREVTT